MEFAWKAVEVNAKFSTQHMTICHSFPTQLGFYSCSSSIMAKTATKEFQSLNFQQHTYRKFFDLKINMYGLYASQFHQHQPLLEEFWANLQDQFEVRKRGYERLTIPQMRDFQVKTDILKDTIDDGITLNPKYDMDKVATKDLEPINWVEKEETKIRKISQGVVNISLKWIELRLKQPRVQVSKKRGSSIEPTLSKEIKNTKD